MDWRTVLSLISPRSSTSRAAGRSQRLPVPPGKPAQRAGPGASVMTSGSPVHSPALGQPELEYREEQGDHEDGGSNGRRVTEIIADKTTAVEPCTKNLAGIVGATGSHHHHLIEDLEGPGDRNDHHQAAHFADQGE